MSLILSSLYLPLNMLRYQVDARVVTDVRNRIQAFTLLKSTTPDL